MKYLWQKVSDNIGEIGDQFDVLMYSSDWACPLKGMVTIFENGIEWSMHDQINDKYIVCPIPEFWMKIELPN